MSFVKSIRSFVSRLLRRPSVQEWGLTVAIAVSTRGECTRRRVGAVILDKDSRICGAGYNGTYRGGKSCLEGGCPRGAHYQTDPGNDYCACACGQQWPCPDAVPPGSSYDTGPGACIAVHAELNALLDVSDRGRLVGATLYVTATPCGGCLKILRNTQVYRIVWLDERGETHDAVWPFVSAG